jgi:hypothetical protein
MKSLLVLVIGLGAGLWLSATVSGCGPDSCPEPDAIPAGSFVPDSASTAENDYTFTLSATTRTAVETFTRNGRLYRLEYAVTGELAAATTASDR